MSTNLQLTFVFETPKKWDERLSTSCRFYIYYSFLLLTITILFYPNRHFQLTPLPHLVKDWHTAIFEEEGLKWWQESLSLSFLNHRKTDQLLILLLYASLINWRLNQKRIHFFHKDKSCTQNQQKRRELVQAKKLCFSISPLMIMIIITITIIIIVMMACQKIKPTKFSFHRLWLN